MKPAVSLIILTLLFSSCHYLTKKIGGFEHVDAEKISKNIQYHKPQLGQVKKITIEEIDKNSTIYLNQVFDTVYGIKLDNHPNALIGSIDKIRSTKDAFYILDRYSTKSLKKFDRNGKYLLSYGKLGGGPSEYYELTDYAVTDKEVIIYDQFKHALLFYDLNGNFIKDRLVPFFAISFHIFNDTTLVFHTMDSDNYHIPKILDYSLHWVDSSFNIRSSNAFREKDKYRSVLSKNNMDYFNNKLYYHEPHSDSVFSIAADGSIYCEYIYDFPNKLDAKYLLKGKFSEYEKVISENSEEDFITTPYNPIITKDFLFTNFGLKNQFWYILYANNSEQFKLTGATFMGSANIILFDPFFNILNSEENTLIGYHHAHQLLERVKGLTTDKGENPLHPDLKEFVKDIQPNDNPILVFYKLKEF